MLVTPATQPAAGIAIRLGVFVLTFVSRAEARRAGQALRALTVRLPIEAAERLRQAAFAARLPESVLARDLVVAALEAGHVPAPAPAPADEQPPALRRMLEILHALVSNLMQVKSHAERIGPPFSKLAVEDGYLDNLASKVRKLGFNIKAGELKIKTINLILSNIESPAYDFNYLLAKPLNEGQPIASDIWKSCLESVQRALSEHEK